MEELRRDIPEHIRVLSERIRGRTADFVVAYNAADVERALAFFDEEIVYLPADRPALHGAVALRCHFEDVLVAGLERVSLTPEEVLTRGAVAVQRGRYHRLIRRSDRHTLEQQGSYDAVWRIGDCGEYRITSWIYKFGTSETNGVWRL